MPSKGTLADSSGAKRWSKISYASNVVEFNSVLRYFNRMLDDTNIEAGFFPKTSP